MFQSGPAADIIIKSAPRSYYENNMQAHLHYDYYYYTQFPLFWIPCQYLYLDIAAILLLVSLLIFLRACNYDDDDKMILTRNSLYSIHVLSLLFMYACVIRGEYEKGNQQVIKSQMQCFVRKKNKGRKEYAITIWIYDF